MNAPFFFNRHTATPGRAPRRRALAGPWRPNWPRLTGLAAALACGVGFYGALALILGGCAPAEVSALNAATRRAEAVARCADGAIVMRDPWTGRLLFFRNTGWTVQNNFLAPGVTPDQFCARAA